MTSDDLRLDIFLKTAAVVSRDHPVVISKYITGAKEVEMDAIGNEGELVNYAIAEHIENAGVHSGDATLLLPAQRLFVETHRRVKSISQKLCKALKISGVKGGKRSARRKCGNFRQVHWTLYFLFLLDSLNL